MSHNTNSKPPVMTVWSQTGLVLMSRLLGADAEAVTPVSVISVRCEVMNVLTEEQVVVLTVSPSDVIVTPLVTDDDRWTTDSIGYNFIHEVPAEALPLPGKTYRLSYEFTPLSGEPFDLVHDFQTKRAFAS